MTEDERKAKLAELDAASADIHCRYMRIVCKELRAVPTLRVAELGMIVGGTTDYCDALRKLADMGEGVAEIICTAATATLMTECEARSKERDLIR